MHGGRSQFHYATDCYKKLGGAVITRETNCQPAQNRGLEFLDKHTVTCAAGEALVDVEFMPCNVPVGYSRYVYKCKQVGLKHAQTYFSLSDSACAGNPPLGTRADTANWEAQDRTLENLDRFMVECPRNMVMNGFHFEACPRPVSAGNWAPGNDENKDEHSIRFYRYRIVCGKFDSVLSRNGDCTVRSGALARTETVGSLSYKKECPPERHRAEDKQGPSAKSWGSAQFARSRHPSNNLLLQMGSSIISTGTPLTVWGGL